MPLSDSSDPYRTAWLDLAQTLLTATPPCPLRDHVEFRLQTPLRALLRVQSPLGLSVLLLELEHGTALLLVAQARDELALLVPRWREQWLQLSTRLHAEFCAECVSARR